MSLMRYQPRYSSLFNRGNHFDQLHKELNQFFNSDLDTDTAASNAATSNWVPAVDVKETDNEFILHADIPGVDPKDIDVHMEDGMLTIKGQRESEKTDEKEGYTRVERSYGSFYRRFSMPDTADANKVNAKCNNGVLKITIPKQEKAQARKIKVDH